MKTLVIMIAVSFGLNGFMSADGSRPDSLSVEAVSNPETGMVASSAMTAGNNKREAEIRHKVKDNKVYVEVVVSNFTFTKPGKERKKDGQGHIHLYLDGQKVDEIHQAAFIVRGIPKGKHTLKVVVVHNDHSPYPIKKEFDITI